MNVGPGRPETLPFLTADLPGCGGDIKRFDEDFIVEEIPRYAAVGRGTHTYLNIEKRGLTTPAAIRRVARALGKSARDVGYAGLKDAHGITRQWLSIEHVDPQRVASLELDRLRVLAVDRHTNKIKLGHLAGNKFAIKLRATSPSPLETTQSIVEALTARGVPNYFGPQRFGVRGDNALVGRAVLLDDFDEAIALVLGRPTDVDRGAARAGREAFDAGDLPESADAWSRDFPDQARICRTLIGSDGDTKKAWLAVPHSLRKLYVSAVQSDLFNRVVARRIAAIDRLLDGDVAWKHSNGACFQVDDIELEQPRCDAFEISPTGPLFGRRMTEPKGEAARIEADVLAESGLLRDQIRVRDGSKLDGARRPLRVPLGDPALETGDDVRGRYLLLAFTLPPGAYATSVIREIRKRD